LCIVQNKAVKTISVINAEIMPLLDKTNFFVIHHTTTILSFDAISSGYLQLGEIPSSTIHCEGIWTLVQAYRSRLLCVIEEIFFAVVLTAFAGPWPLLHFRNHFFTQTVGLLGRGSASSKVTTYTQDNTNTKRIHRHPCLEWDSNPPSQRSSERRKSMTDGAATVSGNWRDYWGEKRPISIIITIKTNEKHQKA
jgi:hypothetical protein